MVASIQMAAIFLCIYKAIALTVQLWLINNKWGTSEENPTIIVQELSPSYYYRGHFLKQPSIFVSQPWSSNNTKHTLILLFLPPLSSLLRLFAAAVLIEGSSRLPCWPYLSHLIRPIRGAVIRCGGAGVPRLPLMNEGLIGVKVGFKAAAGLEQEA